MYRALYRKWRPRTFADVIGQDPIVSALKHQVAAGRIGHAYLFTGTRGTGKTTCAKILAKAVNCPNCRDGDPCGECEICRGVEDGSLLDVVEIDAASNNGVDDVRSLREDAVYTPSMGSYKVYIVDEVHMLSIAAFNALLKIMEEPPPHLIFILATTEVQKVPVTILSRCQRYDFMRISAEDIAGRLTYVAGEEKIDLTPDAALLLGQLADGAMRDALSLLDTCAGLGGTVDEAMVRRVAGVTDRQYLFTISRAVAQGDIEELVTALNDPVTRSLDTRRLCEELIFHYRNLMLSAVSPDPELLLQTNQTDRARYVEVGGKMSVRTAAAAVRRLGDALEHMMRGGNARIELELALFALANVVQPAESAAPVLPAQAPAHETNPQPAGNASAAVRPAAAPPAPASEAHSRADEPAAGPAEPAVAEKSGAQPPAAVPSGSFEPWPRVLAMAAEKDMVLSSFLKGSVAYRQGNRVLIQGNTLLYEFLRNNKISHANLKEILQTVTGEALSIGPYHAENAAQEKDDPLEILRRQGVEVREE